MTATPINPNRKRTKRLGIILFAGAIAMFGFGYLMVPLYDVLCNALGINGKTGTQVTASVVPIDKSRTITVQFIATNNKNLPWKFYPLDKSVKLHPGESKRIAYFAENVSGKTMTVQAIPSVTPGLAANYLKKTECFCFNQQTLKNKETMDMPLIFHLDRDLPKNIRTVTLSYTLFDVTKNAKQTKRKRTGRLS